MERLATTYLTLPLKNPIIAASSPLTSTVDKMKKLEDAGVAAVVVKSIFEEQIDHDAAKMIQQTDGFVSHTDGHDFLEEVSRSYYIDSYLSLVQKATEALEIPVIASINCRTKGSWLNYVDKFAQAGADALELNYYILPSNFSHTSTEIENEYFSVIEAARKQTRLPIAVKLGTHFTALANVVKRLDEMGINGFVLFNRFYQPDIHIDKMATNSTIGLSNPDDYAQAMQWTALLSAYLNGDICASTGIHSGKSLIKMLLAGAKAVQLCSAIMKKGDAVVAQMLDELTQWMDKHEAQTFVDFRGKLAHKRVADPTQWERAQYMKSLNVEF